MLFPFSLRTSTICQDRLGDKNARRSEKQKGVFYAHAGTAKTKGNRGDEGFTIFESGSFWGEMQFLGLERQR
jgi:hypothetical protein